MGQGMINTALWLQLSGWLWALTAPLPPGFVYLEEVAPTIVQEMRYGGPHNFTGQQVPGYQKPRCVLTRQTALALAQAQRELQAFGLGLKVYDCYRPQRAVDFFGQWALDAADRRMAQEFYPDMDKRRLHGSGYIAHRSGHSRGGTVDLTLIADPAGPQEVYGDGAPLRPCTLPYGERFGDNSLDMGTGYDCFDPRAHTENPNIRAEARRNRLLLRQVMRRYGLINYPKEWWHYTYYNEPFKQRTFDFVIR
jgi:D-alanyl-D-alanine dipeptidase